MLLGIHQLSRIGRFSDIDQAARFGRLTLIVGNNGAGKSTLARVCAAAAARSGADLDLDRTLGSARPPEVALELDRGVCRFDGAIWSGPRPRIEVFDGRFVENNVHVGRQPTKDSRRELLRIALGTEDVAYARELDELSRRGRLLSAERRPHEAAIAAAAATFGLSAEAFIALEPIADLEAARARADVNLRAAQVADEIVKRPRPEPIPPPPPFDAAQLRVVLQREVSRRDDAALAQVESHLAGRLRGLGETWVRSGLAHVDGITCPFCAQPSDGAELLRGYRAWFDPSYDEIIAAIERLLRGLGAFELWWRDVLATGQANRKAFDAWSELERPELSSTQRRSELDQIVASVRETLELKRRDPTRACSATAVDASERLYLQLVSAVTTYNTAILRARREIDSVLVPGTLAVARAAMSRIAATAERYAPRMQHAVAESARIAAQLEELKLAKVAADRRLKAHTRDRLTSSASAINHLLTELGAGFVIDEIRTERGGGTTCARYAIGIPGAGTLEVANAEGESRFARVLSDGDRSTLAFAVFLYALEQVPDLGDHVVILDDPMTSQDAVRSRATAARIADLATRAQQVIVLSHQPGFLAMVADAWHSVGGSPGERVDLQLDAARRALIRWDAGAISSPSAGGS